MKLCIEGIPEDIQQMIAPMVSERGEKLKITVYPCPIEDDQSRRYYVEVERKKKMEKRGEESV